MLPCVSCRIGELGRPLVEMEHQGYTVADFRLSVSQPEICVKKEKPYLQFEENVATPSVHIVLQPAKQLPPHGTDPVFVNSRNRVYCESGKFYRYTGTLLENYPENWSACQVVDHRHLEQVQVYLPSVEGPLSEGKLVAALGLDYLLTLWGRAVLHASFICARGEGILFTAPSGTGKSTQAELWEKHWPGTAIINGDRAVIGMRNGAVTGYGFPFCGSSGIAHNASCPLKAIVVLRQGKKNDLERLAGGKALRLLLSECMMPLWDPEATRRVVDVVAQAVEYCPVYLYSCLPDRSAVEHLSQALWKGEHVHE